MITDTTQSVAARLAYLFRHLGLARVHVAARVPGDWQGLATAHPETCASLTLVCPMDVAPQALRAGIHLRRDI